MAIKKQDLDTREDADKEEIPTAVDVEEDADEIDPSKDLDIDYEAIAVAEAERAEAESLARKKAEEKLAERRFKDSERTRESAETDDAEKPLTESRLREILAESSRENKREIQTGRVNELVSKIASSEAEARAIIATHRNRIWPSDVPLEEQLDEARAIVNRKRTPAIKSEIERANKGKEGVTADALIAQRDGQGGGGTAAPKLPVGTQIAFAEGGFKWDPARKLFAKKLPSGKTLFANPKAGQGERKRWTE